MKLPQNCMFNIVTVIAFVATQSKNTLGMELYIYWNFFRPVYSSLSILNLL